MSTEEERHRTVVSRRPVCECGKGEVSVSPRWGRLNDVRKKGTGL